MTEQDDGVWAAVNYDGSGTTLFETKVEADYFMPVVFWPFGASFSDLKF